MLPVIAAITVTALPPVTVLNNISHQSRLYSTSQELISANDCSQPVTTPSQCLQLSYDPVQTPDLVHVVIIVCYQLWYQILLKRDEARLCSSLFDKICYQSTPLA